MTMASVTYNTIDLLTALKQVGMLATQTVLSNTTASGQSALNTIALQADEDGSTLSASCAFGAAVVRLPHVVLKGTLSVALEPKALLHAVGSLLDKQQVTIRTTGNGAVRVQSGGSAFRLTVLGQAAPVPISDAEPKAQLSLSAETLTAIVRSVLPFAASRAAGRPQLENVSFRLHPDKVVATASNGIQLAAYTDDQVTVSGIESPLTITLPPFAVRVMQQLARHAGQIDVRVFDSFLRVSGSITDDIHADAVLHLVALPAPNIMRYLELSDYQATLEIGTDELRRVLRAATGDNGVSSLYLYYKQDDNGLYAIYESPSSGFATAMEGAVSLKQGLSELKVAVNPKYLKGAVDCCDVDTLVLRKTAQAELLLLDPQDGRYRHGMTLLSTNGIDLPAKVRELLVDQVSDEQDAPELDSDDWLLQEEEGDVDYFFTEEEDDYEDL